MRDIPVRPPTAYTDDNTTTFSDPTYQQQTFPQTEYVGGFDMAPLRQGEDGLWPDHSAALLSVDRLAGVGQALHLADASAGRNGSVDADAFFGARPEHATELGLTSMDVASALPNPYGFDFGPPFNQGPFPERTDAARINTMFGDRGGKPSSTPSIISPTGGNAHSDSEGLYTCTECGKPKRRRCELKYVDMPFMAPTIDEC